MSDDRPPVVTSIEGLAGVLWALNQRIADQRSAQEAQREDLNNELKGIRDDIGKLARSADVDQKIAALRDELNRSKPSTLGKQIVVIAAGITTILALLVLLGNIAAKIDRIMVVTGVSQEASK